MHHDRKEMDVDISAFQTYGKPKIRIIFFIGGDSGKLPPLLGNLFQIYILITVNFFRDRF